jgi:hypothetical protein
MRRQEGPDFKSSSNKEKHLRGRSAKELFPCRAELERSYRNQTKDAPICLTIFAEAILFVTVAQVSTCIKNYLEACNHCDQAEFPGFVTQNF